MIQGTQFTKAALLLAEAQKQITELLGVNVLLSFEIETPQSMTVSNIIRIVSQVSGLAPIEMTGKSKTQEVCYCRYVCYYLMRKYLSMTKSAIGSVFRKDHSTVIAGLDVIEREKTNEELQVLLVECEKLFLKEVRR